MIDFVPANVSIMHTDFTRERAQPGHLVVGSDSHTCSAGSMGSLAIGFGAAGTEKVFAYLISRLEETLLDAGGVVSLYKKYEKAIFRHLVTLKSDNKCPRRQANTPNCLNSSAALEW